MKPEEKKAYLERYRQAKEKGVPFFPDVLFKDAVAALLVLLILVALAFFVGAPLEERANPADTTYTPKPEWYFLFLFQLLKYFPGDLEVIGVVILPTLALLMLLILPFLDRGPWRHWSKRRVIVAITGFFLAGAIFLTVQSIQEAPPPAEAAFGDKTAALYAENCAGCHGSEIEVPTGANLHEVIAQGRHEDMPAWTADLTTDEIDALAGFILSPAGSQLFTSNCSDCHEAPELVAGDPLELKNVLDLGTGHPIHSEQEIDNWADTMSREERTALLNFLIAPDGRRLFAINCSSCHGTAVAFVGEEEELQTIISEGGLHLEMPPWREKLSESELDRLASYVVDPDSVTADEALFDQYCIRCHGERIPIIGELAEARDIIASGGAHETMPVWGDVLTSEQLDALVTYSVSAASGTPLVAGQQLYVDNCADCHGDLGEGGDNPARPGDIIAPISTAEYLKTRDDFTLQAVIGQGQPNFGMSPFGATFGGPLDNEQIDSLVAYIRSWEADPPVELPPEAAVNTVDLSGYEVYTEICAQCHGITGAGGVGPSLRDAEFRNANTSDDIFNTISLGHEATDMIAWGAILASDQIQQLTNFIEQLPVEESLVEEETELEEEAEAEPDEEAEEETPEDAEAETEVEQEAEPEPEEEETEISYAADVFPVLEYRCIDCHGTDGGWDASTYDLLMTTGENGPVVIPGDPEASLLTQKLLGTHEEGDLMPPPPLRALKDELIQIFVDWIAAGALDN